MERFYRCNKIFHQQNPSIKPTFNINGSVNLTATSLLASGIPHCHKSQGVERGLAFVTKHSVDLNVVVYLPSPCPANI